MKKQRLWGLAILVAVAAGLLFLFPALALAQSPDANVDFYVVESPDHHPYTVGDRITLRLEVRHPTNSTVDLPKLDTEWGDFEVVSQTGQDTVANGDGTVITRKDIVVTLFAPGSYQTPPLIVTHQQPGQSQPEELGAPVIPLKIDSVLIEGDNELRDLKEQAELPVPPLWPLFLAGVVVAAAVLGGGYLAGQWAYNRWWRKVPLELAPAPVIDTRPPEVIALTELDRIEALDLPSQSQFKYHYTLVTDCLRDYIERRYEIPALEQTTQELQNAFRFSPVPAEDSGSFLDMFYSADLVKFARYRPNTGDAYQLVPRARKIVADTTPLPEPPPDSAHPQPAAGAEARHDS